MEERVAEFQVAAEARLPPDKLAREVATLRRFLFRNQGHRFTQREQAKLMAAIGAHHANPAAHAAAAAGGESLAYGLIDDALKMPFTVFSTGDKLRLLKWFEGMQAAAAPSGSGGGGAAAVRTVTLSCVDVTPDGFASLLLDDGSGTRDDVRVPDTDRAGLAAAVSRGEADVAVTFEPATARFVSWKEG
jgi:hypothetical protein